MTIKRSAIRLIFLIVFVFSGQRTIAIEPTKAPLYVSLIQLIANPSIYDGMTVKVRGFYRERHEDIALYLSKDDSDYGITMNSITCNYLQDKQSQMALSKLKLQRTSAKSILDSKFVLVEGVLKYTNHGNPDRYPAEIIMRKIIEIPPGTY